MQLQDVLDSIQTIKTDENNTAKKVRDVLDIIAKFADDGLKEKETEIERLKIIIARLGTATLIPFEILQETAISANDHAPVDLQYSFKGLERIDAANPEKKKGFTVNFTFKLTIRDNFKTKLSFDTGDNDLSLIQKIVSGRRLNYVVPVLEKRPSGDPIGPAKIIAISLEFKADEIIFHFSDEAIGVNGGEIFTSIHFHCPAFKEPQQ